MHFSIPIPQFTYIKGGKVTCFERVNNKIRLLIKGRTNGFVVSPNTQPR